MRVLTIGATGQLRGLVVTGPRPPPHRHPDSMRAALDGMDGLFLILPAFAPDAAELGTGMVAAAQAAGVQRVVFSGVYHPSLSLVNHADTRPIEEAPSDSDLGLPSCSPRCSCRVCGKFRDPPYPLVLTAKRTTHDFAQPTATSRVAATVACPDQDEHLPHIGLVGDTYTILVAGADTRQVHAHRHARTARRRPPTPSARLRRDVHRARRRSRSGIPGRTIVARGGETINVPANAPHAFTNSTDTPSRLLCLCAPAGQEDSSPSSASPLRHAHRHLCR